MGGDAGYDVFVSYSRSDEVGAAELNGWLRAHGLSTFYDRSELRPGLRWIPGLEDAIELRARSPSFLASTGSATPNSMNASSRWSARLASRRFL